MVRRRVLSAAAATLMVLAGAAHPSRAQPSLPWVGTLTIESTTHYESTTTSQGQSRVEGATTNCKIVYSKTLKDGSVALDYKYSSLSQDNFQGTQIVIDIQGSTQETLDPHFAVMHSGEGDGYQISHSIYAHWFQGTKTTTGRNFPPMIQPSWIQAQCHDPENFVQLHGFNGGVLVQGSTSSQGHYGTSPAELGTQKVSWNLRNGNLFPPKSSRGTERRL